PGQHGLRGDALNLRTVAWNRARVLCGAILAAGLMSPAPAEAASCGVSFPSLLDFGTYDTVNALAPAGWTYTVTCIRTSPGNSPDAVTFSESFSVGSGTYAARTLRSGWNALRYNLYANAGRTQVLGNGTSG